ncbi:hypothetical protein ACFQOY_13660 [Enterococcus alcedinis]|uniref:DUF3168 domain-containing protein n=1 Tax=Enterococcus alcedinis TaxID=1274384 RepID=A0A917JES7_9ENTE|nr:hypothetical protein [Enterococcus alcedinis]MBP2100962.1 hypothetical protein [Enterococcus alcedinis]GGI64742.1 hypothetical protein GCM10011482_03960 [Enterococcus alcedinis]
MNLMIMEIYEALKVNPSITALVDETQINMYESEEDLDTSKPFILIVPLGPSTNSYFGGDTPLSKQFTYQVNVEAIDLITTKEISHAIQKELWEMGYGQLSGGLDEYFKETKRFVEAKRYRKNTKLNDVAYY